MWSRILALLPLLGVAGCMNATMKFAAGPAGVNRYSFRECLLEEGFFSPDALTGIAKGDSDYRHLVDKGPPPKATTRRDILKWKDPEFLLRSAQLIRDGLMPKVQYWPNVAPLPDGRQGVDRPYVWLQGGPRFPGPKGLDAFHKRYSVPTGDFRPDWRLNRFLDCYVAPVGTEPSPSLTPPHPYRPAENGDEDVEGRLLRGHILVAILARFGADLVTSHASGKQVGQAERLLGHVRDAELSLRAASAAMNPARLKAGAKKGSLVVSDGDGPMTADALTQRPDEAVAVKVVDALGVTQPELRWFGTATRLLRVFQIGVDASVVEAQQSLDRARNLLAAFSAAGAPNLVPILKDAVGGFASMQKTQIYGDALIRDARETLRVHRSATTKDGRAFTYQLGPERDGWLLWDEQLKSACAVLATVAKREDGKCVPTAEQLAAALP